MLNSTAKLVFSARKFDHTSSEVCSSLPCRSILSRSYSLQLRFAIDIFALLIHQLHLSHRRADRRLATDLLPRDCIKSRKLSAAIRPGRRFTRRLPPATYSFLCSDRHFLFGVFYRESAQNNFLHVNYVGENPPTRANRPPTPGISPKWVNRLFFELW